MHAAVVTVAQTTTDSGFWESAKTNGPWFVIAVLLLGWILNVLAKKLDSLSAAISAQTAVCTKEVEVLTRLLSMQTESFELAEKRADSLTRIEAVAERLLHQPKKS